MYLKFGEVGWKLAYFSSTSGKTKIFSTHFVMTSICNRSTKVSSHLYFDAGVDERGVESSSGELRDRCWTHSRPLQSADLAGEGDPLRGGRNAMRTWGRCQRGSTRSRG